MLTVSWQDEMPLIGHKFIELFCGCQYGFKSGDQPLKASIGRPAVRQTSEPHGLSDKEAELFAR
jgi:hypothetical protein